VLEAAYILSILLMIFIPLGLAFWLRRRFPTPWLLFGLGALTFAVAQAVHIPLNNWLADVGLLPGESAGDLPLWQTALTLGLTAALCEELARAAGYLALYKLKPAWLRLQDGIMLGLGHGGFEAMVFGGILTAATVGALMPLLATDLASLGLSGEQLTALEAQLSLLEGTVLVAFVPLLERLLAISAQVVLSLLVWRAFASRRLGRDWFYILLAIAYHAAIDYVAVWIGQTYPPGRPLPGLLALAAVLIPGWVWAVWSVRSNRLARSAPSPLRGEWQLFWIAMLKELRQAWRTKRVLSVWAVFLIFGMISPLLAKFTPEILGSLEGAEMFAELIPKPTAFDAMSQYIKNITQFGFLLAVLLGMGAVVGEKERGVAAMILSKPMARGTFITSKFSAQGLIYLAGFILAGIGAYYYTLVLFGTPEFTSFILLNLLLWLWLMPFVGLSLLGSTLGKSTVAAGGIGVLLSVALMLVGSLPQITPLLPGGLVGWATQAGQQSSGVQLAAEAANPLSGALAVPGGTAAAAVVVVVMALVLAVGIFEQQEL